MDRSVLNESRVYKFKATCKELSKLLLKIRNLDCVLVNVPIHGNLGDQAIVISEHQFLRKLDFRSYELTHLECGKQSYLYAKLLPKKCVVMIQGGGSLGNIWPSEEKYIRIILKAYAQHPVIIFPQTVTFDLSTEEGRRLFDESHAIYAAHRNLTMFVREEASLLFMREHMPDIRTILVPDIVTSMKIKDFSAERHGILMCMRTDKEKKLTGESIEHLKEAVQKKLPGENVTWSDTVIEPLIGYWEREDAVNEKLKEFASAKLVITDRLHGMVFAALTGTPCIALQNINGKVKGVYQWLRDQKYVYCAESVEEAITALEQIDIEQEYHYNYAKVNTAFVPLERELRNMVKKRG